jgi:RecJ-like exonuclease
MTIKKCPICKGSKQQKSIGMMLVECKNCKGTGRVDVKAQQIVDSQQAPVDGKLEERDESKGELDSAVKKQRGRPRAK